MYEIFSKFDQSWLEKFIKLLIDVDVKSSATKNEPG